MAAKEIYMSFGKQGQYLHSSFSISVLSFVHGRERNRVSFLSTDQHSAHLEKKRHLGICKYPLMDISQERSIRHRVQRLSKTSFQKMAPFDCEAEQMAID